MYSSPRVQRVLDLAKRYADIAVQIERLNNRNKPVGKLVGERISTYQKLVTHLEILEAMVAVHEPRPVDELASIALGVNWEDGK